MAETVPLVRKRRRPWKAGAAAKRGLAEATPLGLMTAPPLAVATSTGMSTTPVSAADAATSIVPVTGLYPPPVSALTSPRDTRQIQDPEELVLEIHKWVAPLAQRVANQFGLYIPPNVSYSFEALPDAFAQVESYHLGDYEIKVDLARCTREALRRGMSLHDFVTEVEAHELGHIAKKTDQKIVRSMAQQRDLYELSQLAFAHVHSQQAVGLANSLDLSTAFRAVERIENAAEVVRTIREGVGEYVMADVMGQAAGQGRLDNPNWFYDPSSRPPVYPDGKTFVSAVVAAPGLGPAAVTRLLQLPHDRRELLPGQNEIQTDFQGWAARTGTQLMSADAPSPLYSAEDEELLRQTGDLLIQLSYRNTNALRKGTTAAGPPRTALLSPYSSSTDAPATTRRSPSRSF